MRKGIIFYNSGSKCLSYCQREVNKFIEIGLFIFVIHLVVIDDQSNGLIWISLLLKICLLYLLKIKITKIICLCRLPACLTYCMNWEERQGSLKEDE